MSSAVSFGSEQRSRYFVQALLGFDLRGVDAQQLFGVTHRSRLRPDLVEISRLPMVRPRRADRRRRGMRDIARLQKYLISRLKT